MARIPVGNFGYQVAGNAGSNVRVPQGAFIQNGGEAIAGALSNIARDQQAEAERLRRQQEAEAKQAAAEAARVKSITAQATAKNGLADLYDASVTGLNDGTADKTKIGDAFNEQSQKIIEDAVKNVAPDHQELVRASLLDDLGTSQRKIRHAITNKDKSDVGAGITAYVEQMQRYAQRGPEQLAEAQQNVDAYLRSAGPYAGLDANQIEKTAQGFKEGTSFTYLDSQVSKSANNGRELKRLSQELGSEKYANLDPQKRNFLEAKIQRNQEHLARAAEIAYNRRLSNLQAQQSRLSFYVENGRDIPPAEFDAFVKGSKGTPFEGVAQSIVQEQKAVNELIRLSPAQLTAKVQDLEKSYGSAPTKEQIIHIDRIKRFANNSIKLLNEWPLVFAVERDNAKIEPLDLTRPDTWASNLAARTAILTEQSQRTGAAPKGLFPQDVAALTGILKTGTVDQKHQILVQLRQGFGSEEVYRATLQQIAPDNPVIAVAGIAASRGQVTTKGRSTANLILRGQEILNPDKTTDGKGKIFPLPPEKDFLTRFSSYERDAFAGKENIRSAYFQSAKAIYAAKSVEEGDYSGEIDQKRWAASIELSTGGIHRHRGRSVVLPYGKDYSDFRDEVTLRSKVIAESGTLDKSFSAGRLSDLPLENIGDGKYIYRAGDSVVVDKTGRPVVLDFNKD